MKIKLCLVLLWCFSSMMYAQSQNRRVVLITIDGLRWQELFTGADTSLVSNPQYAEDVNDLKKQFDRATPTERREALMPFIWNTASKIGVMLGDRPEGCKMNVANKLSFSYPGYNEIFTGHPDDERITSNDKIYNPNVNVFEVINNTPKYHGKVLVFGSWDAFPYILNEQRSKLEINAGFRHSMSPKPTKEELELDELQDHLMPPFNYLRHDVFSYKYAVEAMKTRHPELIEVGFGEDDDYGHQGKYDFYLKACRHIDDFIAGLWKYAQSDKFYRDKTTFIVTCDHGRGYSLTDSEAWRNHGSSDPSGGQTWLVAFGKGIPSKGILKTESQYYTEQIAATIASMLGVDYHPEGVTVGKKIDF